MEPAKTNNRLTNPQLPIEILVFGLLTRYINGLENPAKETTDITTPTKSM